MFKYFSTFTIIFSCFVSGCVSTTEYKISQDGSSAALEKKGTYHKVRPGETIWRIAKTYDVTIDDIIKNNRIPNIAQIEKGQLIFIPGATSEKTVVVEKSASFEAESNDFAWPLKGKVIAYFGEQKGPWVNRGIDIQPQGDQMVCAARGGEIVFADDLNGYAKTVIVDHKDGFMTVYAQNAGLLVKLGDAVKKGTPIAQVGKKNELVFLHFEVRKSDKADNPLYYLP